MRVNSIYHGIKCDCCDFKDDSIQFEDYPEWLNKPCPKCGANLLTQADFDTTQKLARMIDNINSGTGFVGFVARVLNSRFFHLFKRESVSVRANFNGTGKVSYEVLSIGEVENETD